MHSTKCYVLRQAGLTEIGSARCATTTAIDLSGTPQDDHRKSRGMERPPDRRHCFTTKCEIIETLPFTTLFNLLHPLYLPPLT